jgi:hypothetical protein
VRSLIPLLATVLIGGLAAGAGAVLTYRALTSDSTGQNGVNPLAQLPPTDRRTDEIPESHLNASGPRPGLNGERPNVDLTDADLADADTDGEPDVVDEEIVDQEVPAIALPSDLDSPRKTAIPTWPDEAEGNRFGVPSGSPRTRMDPVMEALYWLKAHQSPTGAWQAGGFRQWCKGQPVEDLEWVYDAAKGNADRDVGVTGLALAAYLGAGYTHRGKHPFRKSVSKGLRYLKNVQDPEGCFGPRDDARFLLNHAFAALAMTEAYGMTASPIFKGSAQRALTFIAAAQNPNSGWGAGIRDGTSNSLMTGLMMFPVKSALLINADRVGRDQFPSLVVDATSFDGVLEWMDGATNLGTGHTGYFTYGDRQVRPPSIGDGFSDDASRTPTALGMLARVFVGQDPQKTDVIRRAANELASRVPTWDPSAGTIDAVYSWLGSLAAFQAGGPTWKAWKRALDGALIDAQRHDDLYCEGRGSFDPAGAWGAELGRVGTTALLTMSLEVYYRYDRVFGMK